VPVGVVDLAFAGVAQDLKGLGHFLEPFFGFRVARVLVRVILHRQPAISLLDLRGGSASPHAEHLVVVALTHRPGTSPAAGGRP